MPLPESWTQVPVTGTFLRANGDPNAGTIVFKRPQLVDVDGTLIAPTAISVRLDENGQIPAGFALPATDDPDLSVRSWAYLVTEHIAEARGPYQIIVPFDGGPINLVTAPQSEGIGNAQSPMLRKTDIGVLVASQAAVEQAAADAASALAFNTEAFSAINDRIDDAILAQNSGMLGYQTKALLDADLAHADQTLAMVLNDPTPENNITYRKSGAIGAGVWVAQTIGATDQQLRDWTEAESYEATSLTRDATGVVTSATVKWPDGSAGVFTATTINTTYAAIDAYTITYVARNRMVTQAAVTRNSFGDVITKPALTVGAAP